MSDYWQFPQDDDADHVDSAASPAAAASGPRPPLPPPWTDSLHREPPTRLYRSRNHRIAGGVAGGIAHHLGVDPLLIRLATVLVLMSGIGLFAYLAAWVVMPLEPLVGAPPSRRVRRGQGSGGADSATGDVSQLKPALLILFFALFLGAIFESATFVALWLVGGGIWLLSQHPKPLLAQAQTAVGDALRDTPNEQAVPLSPEEQQRWRRQYEWEAERYGWPDIGEPPAEVHVPTPPRPRQTLTRLVLALLLLLLALGTAASAGAWWDVEISRMLGIALVIVGGGVVLGSIFRNRSRGLIPLGLLLAVVLLPMGFAGSDGSSGITALSRGVGVRAVAPTTAAMLEPSYELGIGELTIDLSRLDLMGETRTVDVNVAAGELQVLLPPDIGGFVSVESSVGSVSVDLLDRFGDRVDEGINISTGELPLGGSNGELYLKIKASVGDVQVRQVES